MAEEDGNLTLHVDTDADANLSKSQADSENNENNNEAAKVSQTAQLKPSNPFNPPSQSLGSGTRRLTNSNSLQTLQSKISTTEAQLSATLRQIAQLQTFPKPLDLNPDSDSDLASSTPNLNTSISTAISPTPTPAPSTEESALTYANHVFTRHITLLKQYNEIKDIAMGMLSIIADKEGRRLVEIMDERGMSEVD